MKVLRAQRAGFCMGVLQALRKLDDLLGKDSDRPIYTLGDIIHNPQVLHRYAAMGVRTVERPEDVPPGATVVIRAHGIPREVKIRLRQRRVLLVEATCSRIRTAQRKILNAAKRGDFLLLYGEKNHPEVRSLLSYARAGAFSFESREQLSNFPFRPGASYCLASQTTQNESAFERIVDQLSALSDCHFKILHTICDATHHRQQEAVRIAGQVDSMVVVGGFNSGNTRRLAQVVEAQQVPVVQVEVAADLPLEQLRVARVIGLTAGASTPQYIIDEIEQTLNTLP